jgi:Xaa-Pro aminopeptidase
MSWPADADKLGRVRRLMADHDLDALVVRAPDNVLYLTNYWPMKGYDVAVFPREGDPVLVVLEPQREEAERTAWTSDVRPFAGYDETNSATTGSQPPIVLREIHTPWRSKIRSCRCSG